MSRASRASGLGLIVAGLTGAAFFVLTDPKIGPLKTRPADNLIDSIRIGSVATCVGLIGSALVVLIGLWLAMRKT